MERIRGIIIIALTIVICFVLQCTVFPALSFSGIGPNLMIIVTISYGLMLGEIGGMFTGLFCGLLCDVFFAPIIGEQMLLYAVIGFLFGKFERLFFADELKFPLLMIAVGDFLYGIVSYIFDFLIRGRFFLRYFLVHFLIPEIIYSLLCALVIYPLLLLLYRRYIRKKRESEKNFV